MKADQHKVKAFMDFHNDVNQSSQSASTVGEISKKCAEMSKRKATASKVGVTT